MTHGQTIDTIKLLRADKRNSNKREVRLLSLVDSLRKQLQVANEKDTAISNESAVDIRDRSCTILMTITLMIWLFRLLLLLLL